MFKSRICLLWTVCILASFLSGCAYLKNRGNDAMDMFDLGLTVSSKPGFALYLNKPPILPIGFSHVEGKLIGLGRSNWGVHDFRQKGYGYLIGGPLQRGVDNYDVQSPDDPKTYGTGLIGFLEKSTEFQSDLTEGETQRPWTRPSCPLTVHLGWVGFDWTCKFWDMLDFLIGWTTLDIGKDDVFPQEEKIK